MNVILSVIIPVYNAEKYLDRCVSSVLNQTYSNLEVILVDDGSTDNSVKMCDAWAEKDHRVRVIHKDNAEPGAARNSGLEIIGGGYVTFVDSDDWVENDTYRYMLDKAMSTGADVVGCASVVDYENGTHAENYSDISEGFLDKNVCIIDLLGQTRHAWGAVHNKVFKREIFDKIRFPEVRHLEDYLVTTKVFNETNHIYFCSHPYYHHTSLPGSLSHSSWNQGRLTIAETGEQIVAYLSEYNSNPAVRKYSYRFMYLLYAGQLWSIYKSKPVDTNETKTQLRGKSLNACWNYILHAPKQKGDFKRLIQFMISVI